MLHTIRCYISIILVTIIFGSAGVFFSLFFKRYVFKYAIQPWGKYILKGCGIDLTVEGAEYLNVQPSIIMYNHQSAFDIFAFCAAMPIKWKAVMKKEVATIPFVGWVCRLTGQYFVARDGSTNDLKAVKEISDKIRNGPSVLIAPEGTRSEDGRLLPFKKGGFVIALKAKVPVITMVITGGYNIKNKKSYKINEGSMKVTLLEPIYVENFEQGRPGREKLELLIRKNMDQVINREQSFDLAV